MSFYALPGRLCATSDAEKKARSLFAPSTTSSLSNVDNGFVQAMAKRRKLPTAITAAAASITRTQNQRVILDFSKLEIDAGLVHRQSLAMPYCIGQSSSLDNRDNASKSISESYRCPVDPYYHRHQLKIHVNEAVVDIHKLVRPSRGHVGGMTYALSRRMRRSRLHRRQQQMATPPSSSSSSFKLDPYEKAMELELAISFVGRTYTAKRSLQQIMQLRHALLEELEVHEQWQKRRLLRTNSVETSSDIMDASSIGEETGSTLMGCNSSLGDSTRSSSCSMDDDDEGLLTVPDLPRMSDDTLGMFGGGFTQMNGMRHAFRSALEAWFHQVTRIVPDDSPMLANFLWEPLSAKSMDNLHSDFTKLGSIQEN